MIEIGLELDNIDKEIIQSIQEEPNITHTTLAKKIGVSQPTIGMRIKKLEKHGILNYQVGINIKTSDMVFSNVEIKAKDPDEMINLVNKCPFMLIGFKSTGSQNINILVASPNLRFLDKLVNHHFRNNNNVEEISANIITEVSNDLILPLNLRFDQCDCTLKKSCAKLKS
jgi:DNA-binding Lrp family transcriptional regulator